MNVNKSIRIRQPWDTSCCTRQEERCCMREGCNRFVIYFILRAVFMTKQRGDSEWPLLVAEIYKMVQFLSLL